MFCARIRQDTNICICFHAAGFLGNIDKKIRILPIKKTQNWKYRQFFLKACKNKRIDIEYHKTTFYYKMLCIRIILDIPSQVFYKIKKWNAGTAVPGIPFLSVYLNHRAPASLSGRSRLCTSVSFKTESPSPAAATAGTLPKQTAAGPRKNSVPSPPNPELHR